MLETESSSAGNLTSSLSPRCEWQPSNGPLNMQDVSSAIYLNFTLYLTCERRAVPSETCAHTQKPKCAHCPGKWSVFILGATDLCVPAQNPFQMQSEQVLLWQSFLGAKRGIVSSSLPLCLPCSVLPSQSHPSSRKSLTQYYADIMGTLTALLK